MTAVRQFRADAPVPDHARLTPARQRLLTEITKPQRGHAGWQLKTLGVVASVVAAALLSTLPLGQERAAPTEPDARPERWVYKEVRWDTWQCGTGASTDGYSEVGSFNLGPASEPCQAAPTKSMYKSRWIRYDGESLATPDESTSDPDDVDVWKGQYQVGWEMLPPEDSDALVAHLPDDPTVSLRLIRARSVPTRLASTLRLTRAQRDFAKVVEILSEASEVQPNKAQTIYRVIMGLEGVTKPTMVTDGVGRSVLAIGVDGEFRDYSDERNGMQVLLDPDSFAYRGVRYVAELDYYVGGQHSGGPFVAKGTVLATATRISTAIVDKAGRRR